MDQHTTVIPLIFMDGVTNGPTIFVSFAIILVWRMYGYFFISRGPVNNAILVGSGEEMKARGFKGVYIPRRGEEVTI